MRTVTQIVCEECHRTWREPAERWRMYLTDDEPAVAVPYCPECAAREFDDPRPYGAGGE